MNSATSRIFRSGKAGPWPLKVLRSTGVENISRLRRAWRKRSNILLHAGGARTWDIMYAWRAQALAHLGRFDEARRDIETGRLECESTGQLSSLIELAYSRGVTELLDPGSDDAIAEHWFKLALTDSRSIGSRLIELRAATSMASLWKANGKRREAQDVLRPVVSAFTEGLDCQDVTAAIALLDSLDVADRKT